MLNITIVSKPIIILFYQPVAQRIRQAAYGCDRRSKLMGHVGNEFLPLASLAGMFYVFPLVLPFTKGNVVKTLIVGIVVMVMGLYMVTNLAQWFTLAAKDVYAVTGDAAVAIPAGFDGGSLDFASSPLAWVIFQCVENLKWIGSGILVAVTMAMMWWNRVHIIRNQRAMIEKNSTEIQTPE